MKNMVGTANIYKYIGLLYDCPMQDADAKCPFSKYREKGFYHGIREFTELDPSIQLKLIEHHQKCISEKEKILSFSRI
jgi:hypothetical protein